MTRFGQVPIWHAVQPSDVATSCDIKRADIGATHGTAAANSSDVVTLGEASLDQKAFGIKVTDLVAKHLVPGVSAVVINTAKQMLQPTSGLADTRKRLPVSGCPIRVPV